jgi:NAD(P)-dependent dehydrogenase (short-subunit alcohol dehydrogenase family)
MQTALIGKRVLVTQAAEFMGPALCDVFIEQGAEVMASTGELSDAAAVDRVVREAGRLDVLLINLAVKAPSTLAPHNVQVNAIAQNFVDNPTYFPAEVQANPRFQERLAREVPLGRLVSAREDAQFAAYLCSDAAACFVGQVFPVCGGWAPR